MAMLDIIPVMVDEGTRAGRLPHLPGSVLHHPQLADRQFWQVENAFMSVPSVSPVRSMSVYEINTIGD